MGAQRFDALDSRLGLLAAQLHEQFAALQEQFAALDSGEIRSMGIELVAAPAAVVVAAK